MRRFWKRDDGLDELKRDLRARRATAPPAFVRALAQRTGGEARWLRPKMRFGLAAGLAVIALVAVASAGGFSAARSTTHSVVSVIKKVTGPRSTHATEAARSAATAQYRKKCGSKPKEKCELEIQGVAMKEGTACVTTPFIFTVTMKNGPSDEVVSVHYATADGSAKAGTDYQTQSGTVTFPPGTTSQTITIQVYCDTLKEKDETFFVRLSAPSANATIAGSNPAVGTIRNDD